MIWAVTAHRFMALACLTAAALVGCGEDEQIRRYTVPREQPPPARMAPAGPTGLRMLAAIVPVEGKTWFFKVVGPAEQVASHADAFLELIRSIDLEPDDGAPIAWTAPAEWEARPGSDVRFATLMLPASPAPLELTVIPLVGDGGGSLANVIRWRGEVGLGPVTEAGLADDATEVDLGSTKALVFDLIGPTGEPADSFEELRKLITYETPSGWEEIASPEQDRIFEFHVHDGDQEALVTVTAFPGTVGGLAANVNRWRQQVGLGRLSDAAAARESREIELMGKRGHTVAAVGDRESILAAFILSEQGSLFFKIKGPTSLVNKERPTFDAFVESIRLANE